MKTIHQIYDDGDTAVTAVKRLEQAGVGRDEITLLRRPGSNNAERGALTGGMLGIAAGSAIAFAAPALWSLQPVGAALLLMPLAGGTLGMLSGAIVGALNDDSQPVKTTAHRYAAALRRGGALVIARVPDEKAPVVRNLLLGVDVARTIEAGR